LPKFLSFSMRHPNLEWLFWVPLLACPAVQAQGTSPETLLDKPAVAPVDEALPSVGALRSEAATSFVGNRTLFLAIAITGLIFVFSIGSLNPRSRIRILSASEQGL